MTQKIKILTVFISSYSEANDDYVEVLQNAKNKKDIAFKWF